MHRDRREFAPIPDMFWPDRWLAQATYVLPSGDTINHNHVITSRGSFIPFSFGPQNCAGRALAIVELRMVTCALVQQFDMHVAKGYDLDNWEKEIQDVYLTNRGKLPVSLLTRDNI